MVGVDEWFGMELQCWHNTNIMKPGMIFDEQCD